MKKQSDPALRKRGKLSPVPCQRCGRCCASFHMLLGERDDAVRFSRLRTKKIEVRELVKGKIWKVIFHYPCSHLTRRGGIAVCKSYRKPCSSYRDAYPYNFLSPGTSRAVLEDEMRSCPALREIVRDTRKKTVHR